MENMARTFYILYFISFTTLLFGGLGLFGAFKGQQWALIMVGRRGPEDPADHKVPVLTPPSGLTPPSCLVVCYSLLSE